MNRKLFRKRLQENWVKVIVTRVQTTKSQWLLSSDTDDLEHYTEMVKWCNDTGMTDEDCIHRFMDGPGVRDRHTKEFLFRTEKLASMFILKWKI